MTNFNKNSQEFDSKAEIPDLSEVFQDMPERHKKNKSFLIISFEPDENGFPNPSTGFIALSLADKIPAFLFAKLANELAILELIRQEQPIDFINTVVSKLKIDMYEALKTTQKGK